MHGRFISTFKNFDNSEEKSKVWSVSQSFDYRDKPLLVHKTATLRLSTIRIILCAVFHHKFSIFFHVVVQVYLQSKQRVTRNKYIKLKSAYKGVFVIESDEGLQFNMSNYDLYDAGDY